MIHPPIHLLKILALASFALAIASCSSDYIPSQKAIEEKLNIFETQEVTCPTTRILRDGDTYLLSGEQNTTQNPNPIARITTVQIFCKLEYLSEKEKNPLSKFAILATEVEISILYLSDSSKEQAMIQPLPYFVALTNRFGKITTKSVFQTEVPPENDPPSGQIIVVENILVKIPIDHLGEAEGYEMLVGFQLSEEQMEHIRKTKHK
ncbi:MAG: hypothetical protein CMM32_05930 [Rhodospirillaceae bacterium]|nr:hypothetical protein [Rhodospirillaceae bacterium]|tara:strand:+ start:298 stop:918 length:621 start_codon:yes stop_codon:yes gene_type:complete